MLWVPPNTLHGTSDNIGGTYTDAGIGTAVTAHATNANVKGTAVTLIAGAGIAYDTYGISIGFAGGSTAAAQRTFLCDLLFDPAGGTSWTVIIANLLVSSPSLGAGGYWYYFPLYLKNGGSIGMQIQCNVANISLRVMAICHHLPTRPELVACGTKVETFGATTATSLGTTITPGTSVLGTYTASLGTLTNDLFWFQGGYASTDTTRTGNLASLLDVAVGDATNKRVAVAGIQCMESSASEQGGKSAYGYYNAAVHCRSGENVYARMSCSGTPDAGMSVCAYGLGN